MNNSKNNRPSWDEYFIGLARLASTRSTCLVRQVGAVIVKDNQILATGYNGPPSGAFHCTEANHCSLGLHDCSQTKDTPSMAIHAEMNAICQAAKHGVSIQGATIYITHSPCLNCLKAIISSNIARIVYEKQFDLSEEKQQIQRYFLDVSGLVYVQFKNSLVSHQSPEKHVQPGL